MTEADVGQKATTGEADAALKTYTLQDCKGHTTEKDCWLIIHGKVYDVTNFLDEHPGGYDIVVSNSGKDATEEFEEIGHSKAAKDMLKAYLIGAYAGGDSGVAKKAALRPQTTQAAAKGSDPLALLKALLPVLLVLAAVAYALLLNNK